MNSFDTSSVKFLEGIVDVIPIIGLVLVAVAITMFTIRFHLSPEENRKKKTTWIKKVATTISAYVLIAIFAGGAATQAFSYYTADKDDGKVPGTNSGIDTSNSLDIDGSQYPLNVKEAPDKEYHNNSLADAFDGRSNTKSADEERNELNRREQAWGEFFSSPSGENFAKIFKKTEANTQQTPTVVNDITNGNYGEEEKQKYEDSGALTWLEKTKRNRQKFLRALIQFTIR